jgi:hypothetical protein
MADNVFRYRRLKWGDPEQKLQMLPPSQPKRSVGWLGMAVAAVFAAAVGFVGVATVMREATMPTTVHFTAATHSDCRIKGNISIETGERIYHLPSQPFYTATRISPEYGERWFCTEAEARRAGWRRAGY